jgi:hypothetical protein
MSSGTLAKISPVTPPVLNIKIKPSGGWILGLFSSFKENTSGDGNNHRGYRIIGAGISVYAHSEHMMGPN